MTGERWWMLGRGPFLNAEGAEGGVRDDDSDDNTDDTQESPQVDDASDNGDVTDDADDLPRISREEWEREERERAVSERQEQIARELAEAKRERDQAAQTAASATGGSASDPFADVTAEELRDDPDLRRQKALYDATQASLKAAQDTQARLEKLEASARKAQEERERQGRAKSAYEAGMSIAERMMKRSAAYNGDSRTHKVRQQSYLNQVDVTIKTLVNQGRDGQYIERYLAAHLPDFIAEKEIEYGATPSAAKASGAGAGAGSRSRESVIERDQAAKNAISATGATPSGKSDEPMPDDLAGFIERGRRIRERMAARVHTS